ncbi:alpha/beta fold hydrolase [Thalassococcus lentus]|uniref:Alpha/beta hydrolase n=1 Tax=Thalassococcus lentus TaxID=1210524 RepID=A0ABT4XS92_9RHOB|nr:alpha/beta hydrolase [Thalassococcus lentus]MDA7424795.1 alpha/beta hydrolase [Thalassococcus lentus]
MTWTTQPRSEFGALCSISVGQGPSIVLIHGVGLRAEAWQRQTEALIQDYETHAVDMPGHGESLMPPGTKTLADFADAIASGIDRRTIVIGHSMGAMIALDLAHRYPDRVAGVVALNAIYQRTHKAKMTAEVRYASLHEDRTADPSATLDRWFAGVTSPERNACERWLRSVNPANYKTAYGVFARGNGPSAEALKGLQCPALFMTGAQEPNSTPQMSRAMADLAPKGRAVIVEGAAHMMPMTHPLDVNRELLAFAGRVFASDVNRQSEKG